MSKFDEKEIRRKLEIISQITPAPQSTGRALEKVRRALISEEENVLGADLWKKFKKSPMMKLAAAAVIITAIGFFVVHRRPVEQIKPPEVLKVTKSPADLLTAASLGAAYRRGGITEVEKQCDEAVKMLGPRPAEITVKELLSEFNGT